MELIFLRLWPFPGRFSSLFFFPCSFAGGGWFCLADSSPAPLRLWE